MAASTHRVECINKTDRYNPHERIQNIGGRNADGDGKEWQDLGIQVKTDKGTRWKVSKPRAIEGIESGKWHFYVEQPAGDRVDVIVALSATGNKYLKTTADGDQPNNLLSLPECP